jgi:hypothetical protein
MFLITVEDPSQNKSSLEESYHENKSKNENKNENKNKNEMEMERVKRSELE